MIIPKRKLRERSTLQAPDYYQTHLANIENEPLSYKDALKSSDKDLWIMAMDNEFKSHQQNNTWTLVKRPKNVKLLDSRWVYKIKRKNDGTIDLYKARLAIRGYKQKYGVDYMETFSSVCRYELIRLLLCLAAINKMEIKQFDIKTAFLYGDLEEEIYTKQPDGLPSDDTDLQYGNYIIISQEFYIKKLLEKFNMIDFKTVNVPMQPNTDLVPSSEPEEEIPYRQLIGSLLFLAKGSRPDISFAVNRLAQFMNAYDTSHWTAAKNILRYLRKPINLVITYGNESGMELFGFTDSDYAGDKLQRRSTSDHTFLINGKPISWCSQQQPVVAMSSTAAEYIALASRAREAVWLRRFLGELGVAPKTATVICVDNQSAIRLAKNPEMHNRTKHIDVRYHFSRDLVEEKEIQLEYVATTEQAADGLTKPLTKTNHADRSRIIGLTWITILAILCLPLSMAISGKGAPILWAQSNVAVAKGHHQMFIHEIEQMCPRQHFAKVTRRKKRIVSIALATISAVAVLSSGPGALGAGLSITNRQENQDFQMRLKDPKKFLEDSVKILTSNAKTYKRIQSDFNTAMAKMKEHQTDYDELKFKLIATNYAISYLTHQLLTGQTIVNETNRLWQCGKLNVELMDYLTLYFPCKEKCPIRLGQAQKCEISKDKSKLTITYLSSETEDSEDENPTQSDLDFINDNESSDAEWEEDNRHQSEEGLGNIQVTFKNDLIVNRRNLSYTLDMDTGNSEDSNIVGENQPNSIQAEE
ncbi:unnamed protein product [Allacma fusca]|uniref:Reverse transcriptase Ty1/copia-type domain-containing protein n=1 Tax=Allacma fusca TaxID=39272 RepID=A0A8J2JSD9_9HEXA|nr:unnamed protein product [Allacma fusca]